ncbi:MAG TPA: hypothetical protein VFZ47_12760, partial [Chitinophagaceae bacterium]
KVNVIEGSVWRMCGYYLILPVQTWKAAIFPISYRVTFCNPASNQLHTYMQTLEIASNTDV